MKSSHPYVCFHNIPVSSTTEPKYLGKFLGDNLRKEIISKLKRQYTFFVNFSTVSLDRF